MSAPKFTPGPWIYCFRSAGTCVETESGRTVAVASPTPGVGDYDANARLIAAAPEMYEALRALLDVSKTDDWNGSAKLDDALEAARAALAKAVPQ